MTAKTSEPGPVSLVANPPSFHSLKRLVAFSTTTAVILTALWFSWYFLALHSLQSRIDAILANHEPLYPADFQHPKIPDDQNAVFYLMEAARAVSAAAQGPTNSGGLRPDYYPPPLSWRRSANKSIFSNRRAFDLLRQAADCSQVDWGQPQRRLEDQSIDFRPHAVTYFVTSLLHDQAVNYHIHDDDAHAIEFVRQQFRISFDLEQYGFFQGQVLGNYNEELPISSLLFMIADLQVQGDPFNNPFAFPASRSAVVGVIHMLLDEPTRMRARVHAALIQRMSALEQSQWLAAQATVLRPLLLFHATLELDRSNEFLTAMRQTSYPAAMAALSPPSAYGDWAGFSTSQQRPQPMLVTMWFNDAQCRIAAVALAIRLYRADHRHWPENLNELVPAYLDQIPTNPLIAGNLPIRYVLLRHLPYYAGDRPMLFVDVAQQPATQPSLAKLPLSQQFATTDRLWFDIAAKAAGPRIPSPK